VLATKKFLLLWVLFWNFWHVWYCKFVRDFNSCLSGSEICSIPISTGY
jgi:hypothetical protein